MVEWAHRDKKVYVIMKNLKSLYLNSPNNSGLSGLTIQCYNCETEKEDKDGNIKKRYTYSSLSGAANSQI